MSKTVITRVFVGAVVIFIVGVLLEIIALLTTFAGGVITIGGTNFVEVNGGSLAWIALSLVVPGGLAVLIGGFAGIVAWLGALLNTAQLEDKTWFVLLLVLGIFSFGFFAMLAYVFAGPDSTRPAAGAGLMATAGNAENG